MSAAFTLVIPDTAVQWAFEPQLALPVSSSPG